MKNLSWTWVQRVKRGRTDQSAMGKTGKERGLPTQENSSRLLKKSFYAGCSKMARCKVPEILRNEAYLDARRKEEGLGKRSRWAFFSSLVDYRAAERRDR
jgi:hypothetical protein